MDTPPPVACNGIVARSPTLGDLATRFAATYAQLRNLEEGGSNTHHRYSFVALGQVTNPVRRAMANAGVVVMPSVIESSEADWPMRSGTGIKVTVTVEFTWIAAESGEWLTTRWTGMALDAGDKAYNRAYSAILKQALMKTFLVSSADAAREDPDAEAPERQHARWSRFEIDTEIDTLLAQTDLATETIARFRDYLLDAHDGVKAWGDIPLPRLAQIRDRLAVMDRRDRAIVINAKVGPAEEAA